jgi:hypothetical protein
VSEGLLRRVEDHNRCEFPPQSWGYLPIGYFKHLLSLGKPSSMFLQLAHTRLDVFVVSKEFVLACYKATKNFPTEAVDFKNDVNAMVARLTHESRTLG